MRALYQLRAEKDTKDPKDARAEMEPAGRG
jgi:hypothetical protein